MNDSDNPNSANPNSDSANANDTISNKASRTSDIYERFLNRVQQIDSDVDDINADDLNEPLSYEPLSEEELRLFADFKQDYDSEPLSAVVNPEHADDEDISADNTLNKIDSDNISDDTEADAGVGELADSQDKGTTVTTTNAPNDVDTTIDNPPAPETSKAKKTGAVRGRQVSSVKLLIVGVVCGLLLSTVIVVVLNSTGVLSALTDSLAANNSPEPVSTSVPAAPVAQPNTVETSNSEAKSITTATVVEPKPNKETAVATQTTENAATNNGNTVPPEQVTAATTDDADITYEDFREESQSTLYRETDD